MLTLAVKLLLLLILLLLWSWPNSIPLRLLTGLLILDDSLLARLDELWGGVREGLYPGVRILHRLCYNSTTNTV
jgi:hypothetical protein